MVRIYDKMRIYELVADEPNIFSREIVWIDGTEYRIIKKESSEFSNRRLGTHWDLDNIGCIAYVEDIRSGQLYVTILYDFNILLPIRNTDRIKGFHFDYHRRDNERANERSLYRAAMERVYILPYYRVDVKFRGHSCFKFVNHWLSFPLVYCACKYFFDACYPDGYDSYDKKYPVDFRAGAEALNNIKECFGKKSTRKYITPAYCVKYYANQRDWKWSREYHMGEYGFSPLDELIF